MIQPKAVRSLFLLWTLAFIGCDSPTGPETGLERPRETGDGWSTGSLQSVGMDPGPLGDLLDLVSSTPNHRIHSLLIVRNQRLVFEAYWPGTDLRPEDLSPVDVDFDRNTLHSVASVSKSVTSILTGIAIDQGYLGSVDEPVFSHFPEHLDLQTARSAEITLRHLLSFSSGFEWNEFVFGFSDPRDSHNQMFASQDPIAYLLAREVTTDPGAVHHYNSGDTNLLGEVVRRATEAPSLQDYAREVLFDPLDIDTFGWTMVDGPSQVAFASGGVSLRPRDMAKLGALFLAGGVWNGTRVVSQSWVERSTQPALPLQGTYRTLYGYGFNWWLGRSPFGGGTAEYYRASGWGGQNIYVFPDLDLAVVFTCGGYYENRPLNLNDLLEDYVFAALEG